MKLILCNNKTCVHNTDTIINNTKLLICGIDEKMIIDKCRDTCDKYEDMETYIQRIEQIK